MARKGRAKVIYKGTFISKRSLVRILEKVQRYSLSAFAPKNLEGFPIFITQYKSFSTLFQGQNGICI